MARGLINVCVVQIICIITLAICQQVKAEATIPLLYLHSDHQGDFDDLNLERKTNVSTATNLLAINGLSMPVKLEYMPLSRSRNFMDNGHAVCVMNKLVTEERLARYDFTFPVNMYLTRRLMQAGELTPLSEKEVYLPEVFSKSSGRQLLLTKQITYGETIEKQLALIDQENKLYRDGSEHEEGLLAMFTARRAMYALLYPQQIYETSPDMNLRSYRLRDAPAYIVGHTMCARVPGMGKVIKEINDLLARAYHSGDLLKHHTNYMSTDGASELRSYFTQLRPLFVSPQKTKDSSD